MSAEQNPFLGSIPRAVLRMAIARVAIGLFCVACVCLVYWSQASRLQPVNRELQQDTLEFSRLGDTVEELRRRSQPVKMEETRRQFKAAQGMLFDQPEQFHAWQSQVRHQAAALALETKFTLEPPRPYPGAESKLAAMQASIQITPLTGTNSGANTPPYHRLLKFAQALAGGDRRYDLVGLTVEGNSNSVRGAEAVALLLTEPKEAK